MKTRARRKSRRGLPFGGMRKSARKRGMAGDALSKAEELATRAQHKLNEAHLDERVAELTERLRDSEAVAKAQAKGEELAAKARERLAESQLEDRVNELATRMKESEAAAKARQKADIGLATLGAWLASGATGEKLGVQKRRRRGLPWWLVALLGAGVGYAIGVLTAPKRGAEFRGEFATSAERVATDALQRAEAAGDDIVDLVSDAPLGETGTPLASRIQESLHSDPRTATLPDLTINVAEGTVFVRGTVPTDIDEDAIRSIIESVPGVRDVDLQVTTV